MWSTKGQTLRTFLTQTGRPQADLTSTTSCWQKRAVVNFGGKRRQCGLCAACLLRRMSMHAAEINEASDTYVIADLRASSVAQALAVVADQSQRRIMVEYGSVGTRHLRSEEHTSELQSLMRISYAVFCLNKKNKKTLYN